MLRFLVNNLKQKGLKTSTRPTTQYRCSSDKPDIIIGGGLEKPQGGLKEEQYFYEQNCDLMAKIGKHGTKLKCENFASDCNQFEKVSNSSNDNSTFRETCSLNKHKNCLEEAFFLNEQNECCTKLCKDNVMKGENSLDMEIKGNEGKMDTSNSNNDGELEKKI